MAANLLSTNILFLVASYLDGAPGMSGRGRRNLRVYTALKQHLIHSSMDSGNQILIVLIILVEAEFLTH